MPPPRPVWPSEWTLEINSMSLDSKTNIELSRASSHAPVACILEGFTPCSFQHFLLLLFIARENDWNNDIVPFFSLSLMIVSERRILE